MLMDMALLSCAPVPCQWTWHSARVATSAATPILCRKNAAAPRVARQWVRPRSSAMSIDVALSTRRDVGRDTYSLPKKNAAAPRVARQWTWHYYIKIKDTYSLPKKNAAAPRCHVNGHGTTKLRSRCHVYRFLFCNVDTLSLRRGYNAF